MRKSFLMIAAMLVLSFVNVQAQTKEDVQASKARCEKLEELKVPKPSELAEINNLKTKAEAISKETVEITPLLVDVYYRSLGQTAEGVADATVEKPTLIECTVLSARIGKHAVALKEATDKLGAANSELKTVKNPMKLKTATSCQNYSTAVLTTVAEESAFQAKVIAETIKTISGK